MKRCAHLSVLNDDGTFSCSRCGEALTFVLDGSYGALLAEGEELYRPPPPKPIDWDQVYAERARRRAEAPRPVYVARPMPEPTGRCPATTKAGNPCRNYLYGDDELCGIHTPHEPRPPRPPKPRPERGRCCAKTLAGTQCTRSAGRNGRCATHTYSAMSTDLAYVDTRAIEPDGYDD